MKNIDIINDWASPSTTEIFTSTEVVNKILDILPNDIWENKDIKFLNPCCKSGGFLNEIVSRLMTGLKNEIIDEQERLKHILKNQIFGVALNKTLLLYTRRTLYKDKNITGNIYLNDSEEYKEMINKMKFDVIVGNPPYQEHIGGGNGSNAIAIYNKFIEQAINLNPTYISMIIPAKWYNGGRGLNEFRDNMINDYHIKELHDYNDSDDIFPNVSLGGGVCYFLWDNKHNGLCDFYEHKKNKSGNDIIISQTKRLLKNNYSNGVIRYNKALSILDKINPNINDNFKKLVSSQTPFGLKSNFQEFSYIQSKNSYQLITNPKNKDKDKINSDVFVDSKFITKNVDLIHKYKIFISLNYGSGVNGIGPFQVLNDKFIIGGPGVICTQSYLTIGGFDSNIIVNNVLSYMKTKFFRFLVMLCVADRTFSPTYFSLIPIQDWNESWDDNKLYKKYNLSQEEIDFIESLITKI